MSTRSRIGYVLSDDSIVSVYHHWDGYPEWLGVILNKHYNTDEAVRELIDGGDMSSCYSDNEYDYEKQEFVKRDPAPTYYSERVKTVHQFTIKPFQILRIMIAVKSFFIFGS